MAGSNSAFDPANFRTVIRDTMTMGLPENEADRATFRWSPTRTYVEQDSSANPWDWTDSATTTVEHDDVQVPVALEFARTNEQSGTALGQFDTPRVILTLLDEDYDQVVGADVVLLGQNTYRWEFTEPPIGLFEVTVYRLHLRAMDES